MDSNKTVKMIPGSKEAVDIPLVVLSDKELADIKKVMDKSFPGAEVELIVDGGNRGIGVCRAK